MSDLGGQQPTLSRGDFLAKKIYRAMKDANIEEGEPIAAVLEAVAEIPSVAVAEMLAALDRAKTGAVTEVAQRASRRLPDMLDRIVRERFWRSVGIAGAVVAGAVLGGVILGIALDRYGIRPDHLWSAENCQPMAQKTGGLAYSCAFWVRPP